MGGRFLAANSGSTSTGGGYEKAARRSVPGWQQAKSVRALDRPTSMPDGLGRHTADARNPSAR